MRRCGASNTDTTTEIGRLSTMIERIEGRIDGVATCDDIADVRSLIIEARKDFAALDKKITRHRGGKYTLPFVISSLVCIIGLTSPTMGVISAGLASVYLLVIAFIDE